ncbi:type II secretion system protein GspK [Tanticharoenia sakaeratensis]|uniref:General secretion pathway protein K n=1 Tax=Tanticharoenia sakaeratensis NBRC 103193 TaxID=1231623 RepID=A0A0D6MPP4_9PROT|nr:type II secretion system protein GspK [Tanticharoenia sakaeratensis]GAN55677.1 general secretion pathway protein K [Tanticharoenia sakaeratensis NBRC 103193]GBQ18662.1 hypothetical protein AA103193_0766 [Tanticharoenia sakaeratensis NBRC 103193]
MAARPVPIGARYTGPSHRDPRQGRPREAGFALLLVLLTLGFLALIVSRGLADARLEAQLAQAAQARAQDDASLDAAAQTALFHLISLGNTAWPRNGRHVVTANGNTKITIQTQALDSRVPINAAGPTLIAGLLQTCKVQPDAALRIAGDIVAWRDPSAARDTAAYRGALWAPAGVPFRATADLLLVRGMTPALLHCITPHVSLYQRDLPTMHSPDLVVREALKLSQSAALPTTPQIGPQAPSPSSDGPLIGGGAEPVTRIDIHLTRGTVRRHVVLIAMLATANDTAPYSILMTRSDDAGDLY